MKGVVAKLVRMKDPADATALEVAAGGKLYQVVVDTEATAKALLSKGQLRNRVTIVPLNKARACLPETAVPGRVPHQTAALLRRCVCTMAGRSHGAAQSGVALLFGIYKSAG